MKNQTIDIIDSIYNDGSISDSTGFEREKAKTKALKKVLPIIIERELTERQRVCLNYKYINGKNQAEIAELLKLSQPTVSRHINTAKDIVNNKLQYCVFAVINALDSYDS